MNKKPKNVLKPPLSHVQEAPWPRPECDAWFYLRTTHTTTSADGTNRGRHGYEKFQW